ncbi:hypothetical protein FPV67DRAFT_1670555 [Lyophyllum atratum]|nr:hypothetical protein FPV67DRAFT_1670555 [Lyophyllum atratum]
MAPMRGYSDLATLEPDERGIVVSSRPCEEDAEPEEWRVEEYVQEGCIDQEVIITQALRRHFVGENMTHVQRRRTLEGVGRACDQGSAHQVANACAPQGTKHLKNALTAETQMPIAHPILSASLTAPSPSPSPTET